MKKAFSAFLALISLAFLTACDAGMAAQIGDTKISQSTVQSRIAEILSERTKFDTSQMQLSYGEELNRGELRFLVISTIFQKLAEENGIKITKAMEDSRRAEIINQVGGSGQLAQALAGAQIAPSDFDAYVRSTLISEELTNRARAAGVAEEDLGIAIQSQVRDFTKKVGIKINPQYGTWDQKNADMIAFDAAGNAVKKITP